MSSQPAPMPPSALQGSTDDVYTVIVRGETFQLDHTQIHFDAPNFFSTCFSSGFAEAARRMLKLQRSPTTFAIIVDYLSGYPILPLAAHALPLHMDAAALHRYLLEDARFYELRGLCDLLTTPKPPIDLRWTGYANEMVSLWDVARGELPDGVVRQADGSVVSAENGLPVLVYARNVVVRVSFMELTVQEPNISIASPSVLLTVVAPNDGSTSSPPEDVQLSLPQTFPCSGTGQCPSFIGTPQREEYWYRRDGTPMSEYGQLVVDGTPCVNRGFIYTPADSGWDSLRGHCRQDLGVRMSDSENWVSCYRWSGGVESRNVVYVTYTLLATSFICRVRPWTGIGPHSPSVEPIPVDLVRASLRTKRSILDELRTHIDRGEGK